MTNLNFIDILPFKIKLEANESKEYYFTKDVHKFIVKFSDKLKITISMNDIAGKYIRDDYYNDVEIDRDDYSRIIFDNKNDVKTIITLDNLIVPS